MLKTDACMHVFFLLVKALVKNEMLMSNSQVFLLVGLAFSNLYALVVTRCLNSKQCMSAVLAAELKCPFSFQPSVVKEDIQTKKKKKCTGFLKVFVLFALSANVTFHHFRQASFPSSWHDFPFLL